MTSNINYLSINENFPVAGEDNDTQVFRDNFNTIKTNFRYAKEDIDVLQNNTGGLQCTESGTGSSFGKRTVEDALLIRTAYMLHEVGSPSVTPFPLDWEAGSYKTISVGADTSFTLTNFAETDGDVTNKRVGNAILEFVGGDVGDIKTVTFVTEAGIAIKRFGFPSLTGTYTGTAPDIELSSTADPVLVEIWQHTSRTILIKYLGKFE